MRLRRARVERGDGSRELEVGRTASALWWFKTQELEGLESLVRVSTMPAAAAVAKGQSSKLKRQTRYVFPRASYDRHV